MFFSCNCVVQNTKKDETTFVCWFVFLIHRFVYDKMVFCLIIYRSAKDYWALATSLRRRERRVISQISYWQATKQQYFTRKQSPLPIKKNTCFAHVGQLVGVVAAIVIPVARPRQRHAPAVAASVLSQSAVDVRRWTSSGAHDQRFVCRNCNRKTTQYSWECYLFGV